MRLLRGWRKNPYDAFPYLMASTLTVRSVDMMRKAFGWQKHATLLDDDLDQFNYLEDLNDRRRHDAELIATVCANHPADNIVEIGTAAGRTTALMATNAPDATVHTVNIPPEEIPKGGRFTTCAPERDEIGRVYREMGLENVRQILANTASWQPDISPVDIALIDGSHDARFVYNDTRLMLNHARPGTILLWHDFAPELAPVYPWIADVCRGIDRLFRKRILRGRILHLQDSWLGLYRVD